MWDDSESEVEDSAQYQLSRLSDSPSTALHGVAPSSVEELEPHDANLAAAEVGSELFAQNVAPSNFEAQIAQE